MVIGAGKAAAYETSPIGLTDLGGHLELRYRVHLDSRERPGQASAFERREQEFIEGARLALSGFFYHPLFAKFSVDTELEFRQERLHERPQGEESGDGLLVGGSLLLTILERSPYSFKLYANRRENDVDRPFSTSYSRANTKAGLSASIDWGPFPFRIEYSHETVQTEGSVQSADSIIDRWSLASLGNLKLGQRSTMRWEYEFEDSVEQEPDRNLRRQLFFMNGQTRLSERGAWLLTSDLQVRRDSGILETTSLDLREWLEWQMKDNVVVNYNFAYNNSRFGDQKSDTYDFRTLLRHTWYDSLQTAPELFLSGETSSSNESTGFGARWTESYNKELRDWGRLSLIVSGRYEIVEHDPKETTGRVFNESHQLRLGVATQLSNMDVNTTTIIVTNERGLRIYLPLADYFVVTRGRFTEILLLAAGAITDGETILVDYQYALPSRGTIKTTGFNTDLNLAVRRWLTLKARYANMGQESLSGTQDAQLDAEESFSSGVEVRWRWFEAFVDFTETHSVFSPSESWSGRLLGSWSPWQRLQTRFTVTHEIREHTDTGARQESSSFFVGIRLKSSTRSHIELDSTYRQQRWSQEQAGSDLDAYDVDLRYRWRYKQISLLVDGRYTLSDQLGQRDESTRIDVTLRRRF